MRPRTRRIVVVPLAAFLVALVALATTVYLTLAPSETRPSGIGGPFRLIAQDGRTVTDKDFLGAPHLVFFGFTRCPDVCPTILFQMSEMFRTMGDRSRGIRALFITVDPQRDTPDVMKNYVSSFDDRIMGLTGDQAAIDTVVSEYHAYAKKVPLGDGDYTMEHTAIVYLMDKNGRFVGPFDLNRPPEQAANDLLGRS